MISRTGKINNSRGSALVEALIAFTILAVGIVACFQVILRSFQVSHKIDKNEKTIQSLKPVFFEMAEGRRDDLPALTLDFLESDGQALKAVASLAPGALS